jgi:hypothetical protein
MFLPPCEHSLKTKIGDQTSFCTKSGAKTNSGPCYFHLQFFHPLVLISSLLWQKLGVLVLIPMNFVYNFRKVDTYKKNTKQNLYF